MVNYFQPGPIMLFLNAHFHISKTLLREGCVLLPISQPILPGICGTDYTICHIDRQCHA